MLLSQKRPAMGIASLHLGRSSRLFEGLRGYFGIPTSAVKVPVGAIVYIGQFDFVARPTQVI